MITIKDIEVDIATDQPIIILDNGRKLKCIYNDGGQSLKTTTNKQLQQLKGRQYESEKTLKWYLTTKTNIVKKVESKNSDDYTITDAGEIELKTEDLDIEGLPEKYSNVLLKLYAEGYICDINNVDDELKQELIDNGYEDDYVISFEEQDGLYVVTIPFAYGSPELRVSTNNLCFYDNYVRICDEYTDVTEYPIFIDDTNIDEEASREEGWININNIDEIKDTMSNMGI